MENNWKENYIFSWSTKSELREMVFQSKRENKNFKKKKRHSKTKR